MWATMYSLASSTEGCHSEEAKVLALLAYLQIRLSSTRRLLDMAIGELQGVHWSKKFSWGRFWACVNGHSCSEEKETIWVPLSIIHITFLLRDIELKGIKHFPKAWSNPKLILRCLKYRQCLVKCVLTNLGISRPDFEQVSLLHHCMGKQQSSFSLIVEWVKAAVWILYWITEM